MKKIFLICTFLVGMSMISFAQGGRPRAPETFLESFKTYVTGLTGDQEAKIKVIYAAQIKSEDSVRIASGLPVPAWSSSVEMADMVALMEKYAPIRVAANAKITAVLTADQAAAYKKVLDAQAERMKQMRQGGN